MDFTKDELTALRDALHALISLRQIFKKEDWEDGAGELDTKQCALKNKIEELLSL